MKLKDYMKEVTASATGERTGRQMVLAVDCTEGGSAASPDEYAVVANHVENHGASLNAKTTDKSYIGEGEMTLKTGVLKRSANESKKMKAYFVFVDKIKSFC